MQSPATSSRLLPRLFREDFCIPFLLDAQNQNGGWGYSPGSESRIEPTCWVVRALENMELRSADPVRAARSYISAMQLKDGSWPASPEETRGSWVTSLACSVLSGVKEGEGAVRNGLRWLCEDYPRDSAPWRRFILKLLRTESHAKQDDSLRGWGWTPDTSSWVEPTAFALMAFRDCVAGWHPADADRRCEVARALLYDRMCPGGGWNCGNPLVYGIAGEPLVLPTAWALLALLDQPQHEKKTKSLAWLRGACAKTLSPASRAVAMIALQAYGMPLTEDTPQLENVFDARNFLRLNMVVAWACLALTPERRWFPSQRRSA